ncbi:glycosyltransferase family 4 protein [Thalassotalea agariperforans]
MGAHKKAPFDLAFLKRQYQTCQQQFPNTDFELHSMRWNGTSILHKLFKYPVWSVSFFIKYIFKKNKIDIIHVHFFFPTVLLALLYKIFIYKNVKILINFHGSDIYKYQSPISLYWKALQRIDGIVFASEGLKKHLKYDFQKPSWVIPIGVDSAFNYKEKNKIYDLAFVGRLDENKGIKRFIKAISRIKRPLNVVVVGNGILNNWLNEHWPVQHILTRHDRLAAVELAELYQQSKYLVSCSYYESYGLVIAEALSCGTPVIASKTDGSSTLVTSDSGYLVENDEFFSEALNVVITQALTLTEHDYQQLQERCLSLAHVMNSEQAANKYVQVYSEL